MPWNRGQEIIYVSCRLLDLISSAHRMGTHMLSLDNKVIEKHDDLRYIDKWKCIAFKFKVDIILEG